MYELRKVFNVCNMPELIRQACIVISTRNNMGVETTIYLPRNINELERFNEYFYKVAFTWLLENGAEYGETVMVKVY